MNEMNEQILTKLIKRCVSEGLEESLEELKKEKQAKTVLENFYSNIKSYGGIRKLFAELEKASPEYADRIEETYTRALYEVTKED